MESGYPSAILIFSKNKFINFYHKITLENLGCKSDILNFENSEKALDYIKGITSYFLPEPDPSPKFLILFDLQFCRHDNLQFLNTFRIIPEHKRNWFKFVFLGSDEDFINEELVVKFKTLLHFESKSFEWQNFPQFIGILEKEK